MKTTTKPIPMSVLAQVAPVLRLLGHPHRLKLVELLMAGETAVNDLSEVVGIPPNATSQHLNMMKAHGIVTSRRDGRTVYYQVDNPNARNVIQCIRKHQM
jgi:DNA-binding transcriptional ArsR family regulator